MKTFAPEPVRTVRWTTRTAACAAMALCALSGGVVVGCASPGPPRPPSLHLPAVVTDLKADRRGPEVVLRFTTPTQSTDGFALTAPVTASLCRSVGDGPCVATEPGRRTISGMVEWVDTLPHTPPNDLANGTVRKLSYRVELFSAAGRSAGKSDPAIAAAGSAPGPVEGLHAEGSRDGVVLRWKAETLGTGEVLLERKDLSGGGAAKSPPEPAKKIVMPAKNVPGRKHHPSTVAPTHPVEDPGTVWLKAEANGSGAKDEGGMVDTSAVADTPYRYIAVRSRTVTVDGTKLELRGSASAAVEFTLRDIYPPAVPTGLTAAAFPVEGSTAVSVDLIWQPDTDADLAGYDVYRQAFGAETAAVKLNATPVALPAFHDTTAARGMRYRYTVVALDSKGNVSAASVAAELETAP